MNRETKKALDIRAGDRFLDAKGKEWNVLETRRDPFAPGARWIIIRVSDGDIDTEIVCTSSEKFTMAEFADALSTCCQAPMRAHWPCDQRKQCTACLDCAICGGRNFEPEAMQTIGSGRRWRR